jgi:hypothetical protein
LTEAERWLQQNRRFWTKRLDALAAVFAARRADARNG